MIPSKLQDQIEQQVQETRTQAILSACFSRINQFSLPAGSFGALLRENKKLDAENPGYFRADQVEQRLKDKLDTTQERIGLILKDEQNVRAIDALLASLNTK